MGWAFARMCSVLVRDQKDFTSELLRPDIYSVTRARLAANSLVSCALVGSSMSAELQSVKAKFVTICNTYC